MARTPRNTKQTPAKKAAAKAKRDATKQRKADAAAAAAVAAPPCWYCSSSVCQKTQEDVPFGHSGKRQLQDV